MRVPDADIGRKLLDSAKRNLESVDFFSILEYQKESQQLFEATFRLRFSDDWEYHKTKTERFKDTVELPEDVIQLIKAFFQMLINNLSFYFSGTMPWISNSTISRKCFSSKDYQKNVSHCHKNKNSKNQKSPQICRA